MLYTSDMLRLKYRSMLEKFTLEYAQVLFSENHLLVDSDFSSTSRRTIHYESYSAITTPFEKYYSAVKKWFHTGYP